MTKIEMVDAYFKAESEYYEAGRALNRVIDHIPQLFFESHDYPSWLCPAFVNDDEHRSLSRDGITIGLAVWCQGRYEYDRITLIPWQTVFDGDDEIIQMGVEHGNKYKREDEARKERNRKTHVAYAKKKLAEAEEELRELAAE